MGLLRIFNDLSIRSKVVGLIMLVVSLATTVALGFALLIQYVETKQILKDEMVNLARIIANRTSVAVAFGDEPVARESLDALAGSDNILQVTIYDASGREFSSYRQKGVSKVVQKPSVEDGVIDDFYGISVVETITDGDEVIGLLFLNSNLSPVWRGLKVLLIYTVIIYLLCLLISYFLSIRLQKYITRPILSLLDTSKRISSEHNYELRAEKTQNDEVGLLVGQFNQMLAIIDQNEKALRNTNEELERQVEERTEDLAKALTESKAANHAKSVFLSRMSHELRTPLNAINGYSQLLLREENFNKSQRKQLKTVYQCGEHLLALINDVLAYSHIEAGQYELMKTPFNLSVLLRRVSDIIELQAEQKDLYFEFEPSADLPETVCGDSKRISQVLLNLLSNAVKYTDQGNVRFKIYPDGPSHIVFKIEDSGAGIPKELQSKVFSAFFRAPKTERMVEGLGLGMAIANEYVSAMGGEIALQSEEGVGSTFCVKLPLEQTECEEPSEPPYIRIRGYKGQRRKLLLVDDNMMNLSLLVRLLEPIGFIMRTVDRGEEVERAVAEFEPDGLLLDMKMPGLDGLQVRNALKAGGYQGKVIGISAEGIYLEAQNSFASQCDAFLKKPVNSEELVQTLKELFNLEWELSAPASPVVYRNKPRLNSAVKRPPANVIETLKDLTEVGNFSALVEMLENYCMNEAEYSEFYREALVHAENFDDESLLKIFS